MHRIARITSVCLTILVAALLTGSPAQAESPIVGQITLTQLPSAKPTQTRVKSIKLQAPAHSLVGFTVCKPNRRCGSLLYRASAQGSVDLLYPFVLFGFDGYFPAGSKLVITRGCSTATITFRAGEFPQVVHRPGELCPLR